MGRTDRPVRDSLDDGGATPTVLSSGVRKGRDYAWVGPSTASGSTGTSTTSRPTAPAGCGGAAGRPVHWTGLPGSVAATARRWLGQA
ncbi:hypothetical protein [Streptomyces sp. LN245]|uniref:hypothetical protein n=1 Tax=Streptomyces sp. LN245 TaxID=3112975 RepID=UPI003722AA2C